MNKSQNTNESLRLKLEKKKGRKKKMVLLLILLVQLRQVTLSDFQGLKV